MKAWYLLYCKSRSKLRVLHDLILQVLETCLAMFTVQQKQYLDKTAAFQSVSPTYQSICLELLEANVTCIPLSLEAVKFTLEGLMRCLKKAMPIKYCTALLGKKCWSLCWFKRMTEFVRDFLKRCKTFAIVLSVTLSL